MRISKMILNLTLMAFVASVTTTATASSSCNMRSGVPRTAASNPEKKQVSKVSKSTSSGSTKSRHGQK